jgi:ATP-dependent protease Clp ATPase subunit
MGNVVTAKNPTEELRCSFCKKGLQEVRKLVTGPGVNICDECISVCVDITSDDRSDVSARREGSGTVAEATVQLAQPVWTCSFCRRDGTGTRGVVAGPDVWICQRCVVTCRAELSNQQAEGDSGAFSLSDSDGRCSFCSRDASRDRLLLRHEGASICADCVETCEDIFTDQASDG